jgi:eukaryotic-like serine/threonine-protein kinase
MIGTTLGQYRIVSLLGRGGMGEVYLAEDTRLGREVALKTLPPLIAANAEFRERFEREAKAIAAINHPNIVTIHSVEDCGDVRFITMELVRGKSLAELIPPAGWPLSRVLNVAIPLVDAVASAHEQRITHRDLKPGNVMLGDDGRVKVLDFGLARLGPSRVDADAVTRHGTQVGQVLGTVAYMSPEQAQGYPADHRSDVFSLGIMLFEMATGRLPFEGNSVPGTMAAIIESPPRPLDGLKPGLPDEFARIVRRCLSKEPERRYQSAVDLRNDLDDLRQTIASTSSSAVRVRRAGGSSWRWAAAGVVLAGLAGLLWSVLKAGDGAGTPSVFDGHFQRLTSQSGEELYPSPSPDGQFIVYASRAAGNWDLYLKRVGGEKPINLTEDSPADDTQPAFSNDGRFIAFRSARDGGGIFVMGATGENVRKLADEGFNPAWSADGTELAYSIEDFPEPLNRTVIPSALWAVSVATGSKRLITEGDAVQPSWSPRGDRIAYWGVHHGGQRDVWTIPAAGGNPVQVTSDAAVDWNPVWSPDGRYLYFVSDRGGSMNLWRVAIDGRTGAPAGEAQPATTPSGYTEHPAFSRNGRSLTYVEVINRINLQQVGFDPNRAQLSTTRTWMTQGSRPTKNPNVSPDGEWIVFDSITDNNQEDLFIVDRTGARLRQVTNDIYKDRAPRWSPDASRIAFLSDRSGRYECWSVNPDGSGLKQLTFTTGARWAQAPVWSPDGSRLACNTQNGAPIVVDPRRSWTEQTPEVAAPQRNPATVFFAWSWSPDGRALVGRSATGGIVSFAIGGDRFQQLAGVGTQPIWLRDGRRVLFRRERALYLASTEGKGVTELLSVAPDSIHSFTISHDNRTVYLAVSTSEADVWVASLR